MSGTRPPSDPHADIEACFRDFRESAVRLAERVNDLDRTAPADPVEAGRQDLKLLRTIFGKWSPEVLIALHAAPAEGFEALRRTLTGISPRVLSLKLKELEQNGMVHREVLDARPPRVRYTLTDRGWTVAWLAQPVLLYLRYSQSPGAALPTTEPRLEP
jgi:DNA-binding HxlR family transcriptional regulator